MTHLTERDAYIVMNLIQGIGPARIQQIINAYGDLSEAFKRNAPEITTLTGLSPTYAEKIVHWKECCNLDEELQLVERSGARIVTRIDPEYPSDLMNIPSPPLCLYVKGTIPERIGERSLAVVGTRRISRYGREITRHLTESAVMSGWVIVSGMALGVDAVAHESSLTLGGVTVGVLGTGLGRIYPQEHVPMARKIVETGGAIISEFPMMMPGNSRTFPMRNRIVAGISRGTLVVEAPMNSGALITANLAADYGKTVFAVPGQVDNPLSHGCHWLIKQGAKLTETFDDIMEEFSTLPGFDLIAREATTLREPQSSHSTDIPTQLSDDEEKILRALKKGERNLEQLAIDTEIDSGMLMSLLLKLELKRLIRMSPDGMYAIA